jgi:hypothetical protein
MSDLKLMLTSQAVGALGAKLDALVPPVRRQQALSLGAAHHKVLFKAAERASMVDVLAPEGFLKEKVFEGRNSLPFFSRFQKRFFWTPEGRLFGYNKQSTSFLTGPGYFEVTDGPDGLVFDYDSLPPAVPPGAPAPAPNRKGLSSLFYGGLKDEVRKVGKHILIAKAYKDGKDLGVTFLLVD